nr:replication protein A 70 kDa DNA-binding subunit A-like [Ipomoea batatas]
MAPLFITANELSPMRLKCAIKLPLDGLVKLSSLYEATQILIKEDAPEFKKFKESLSDVQTSLRIINMNSSLSQANSLDTFSSGSMVINTISEVYALRQMIKTFPTEILDLCCYAMVFRN